MIDSFLSQAGVNMQGSVAVTNYNKEMARKTKIFLLACRASE